MLRAIGTYQRAFEGRPSPCRFFPSCSEYGREAIEVHGAGRGAWLTMRRLARCRPFGPSGFDPVPLPRHHDDAGRVPSPSLPPHQEP
jgi:putative membrane protein insertion efficiency factor